MRKLLLFVCVSLATLAHADDRYGYPDSGYGYQRPIVMPYYSAPYMVQPLGVAEPLYLMPPQPVIVIVAPQERRYAPPPLPLFFNNPICNRVGWFIVDSRPECKPRK
jgi:hypothetical protein